MGGESVVSGSSENAGRVDQSDAEVVPEETKIASAASLSKPSRTQRFCKCAVLKRTAIIVALLLYVNIGYALGKWHMKVYQHPELFSVGTFFAFPLGWYNEKFICGTPNESDWFKKSSCFAPLWEVFSTQPVLKVPSGKELFPFPIRQTAYQTSYIFFWPVLLAVTSIEIVSLIIFSLTGILLIGLSLFWYALFGFSRLSPRSSEALYIKRPLWAFFSFYLRGEQANCFACVGI